MRTGLNLEELRVETTAMQADDADFDAGVASIVWDTQTRPIDLVDTNDTRCWV